MEKVTQFGFDRVIDLTFGSGELACHVICEFYAGGNIVLTDANYKISALLRTYKSEDGSMNVSIGETYPTNPQQELKLPSSEALEEALKGANANTVIRDIMAKQFVIGTEMIDHCLVSCGIDGRLKAPQYLSEWTPKLIASFSETLSFAESHESHKGYVVYQTAEDRAALEKAKPQPKKKAKKSAASDAAPISSPASNSASESSSSSTTTTSPATTSASAAGTTTSNEFPVVSLDALIGRTDIFYENFVPFHFAQYAGLRFIEFGDFDAAVDEYFSKVEGQKVEAQRMEQEDSFMKRLDKVREDNQKRVQTLVDAEERARKTAALIEQNAELVDAIVKTINGYLARQIDWTALAELVKQEKKKGDPLASIIHKLKLEQNAVVILLYTPDDKFDEDYDEEEEEDKDVGVDSDASDDEEGEQKPQKPDAREVKEATLVEIDLSLSAHKNSEKYFAVTKKATEKKQKTMDAANVAMKRAERKARSELKEVKLKASIQKIRSSYWFEKFNWFVTSDGFIVVAGRDMQQNELLYKRYLSKGDVYIHADIHGASTCIVKNPTGEPIPPRTLTEAGTLSVCYSSAWKNRILTSAWWVEENQVSKTAPTGEYLSTGSFMIRGKKNFLPPSSLIMGFGILFRLADESIAAHVKETTDEDIRKEKERKHHERDVQSQLKHGEESSSSTTSTNNALNMIETQQTSSDAVIGESTTAQEFTDLGGDGEPNESGDDEDDEVASTAVEAGSAIEASTRDPESEEAEEGGEEEDGDDEEDDDEDQKDDEHDSIAATTTDANITSPTDSKFALDLAKESDTLDEDEAALLEAEDGVAASSSSGNAGDSGASKKRMTKHERLRQKKAEAKGVDQVEKGPKPGKKTAAQQQQQQQQQQQHGKKKKIPKKYRYQDEEERKAAMELLGSAGKPKASPAPAKASSATSKGGNKGKSSKPGVETPDFKQKIEARQKAQAEKLAKDKEEEEIRLLMKEEKLEQLSETDLAKLRETSAKGLGVNLSALTGRPRSTDVLLYAMAVCAPYDALSDFKYKVKITPGTFKKGKSANLAIHAFLHQSEATDREKELIRAIPDTELAATMISNAKLQMPGLNAVSRKK